MYAPKPGEDAFTSTLPLPRPDRYEPNDDAGVWAHTLPASQHAVDASLDYWDDNLDVYRVHLYAGQRVFARLTPQAAATIRRSARIGGGAILCPGIEIGEEAFVGAGAVVTKDVPPRVVVVGSPARVLRDVDPTELRENGG